MKKAAAKGAVNLGTKRTCPKCALKFYDFAKAEIHCPKCQTEVDPQAELPPLKGLEKKASKTKGIMRDDDEDVASPAADTFESIDDLGDDDEEDLEDIATGGQDSDEEG